MEKLAILVVMIELFPKVKLETVDLFESSVDVLGFILEFE